MVTAKEDRAIGDYRAARARCERLGIAADQLDALEPFADVSGLTPDPDLSALTAEQREALLYLADCYEEVLYAHRA